MFDFIIENRKLPTPNFDGQDCWIMYQEESMMYNNHAHYAKWTVKKYHEFMKSEQTKSLMSSR